MLIDTAYKKKHEMIFKEAIDTLSKETYLETYYESALPSYTHRNRLISWLFWKRIDSALSLAKELEGKSVLDFGSGPGAILCYLSKHNCKITACERTFMELTEYTVHKLLIRADLYKDLFEIQDKKFDFIFALDVLEHIEDLSPYLDKLMELSHETTSLIVSGPTENALYRTGRFFAGYSSGHCHARNIASIEEILRAKGFKRQKLKILFPLLSFFRISSWTR